jgi:Mg-chelatase subunit ChlI
VQAYVDRPRLTVSQFAEETIIARQEIETARQVLRQVTISDKVAGFGLGLISHLEIDSLRAEITLFESARAYAAADGRKEVISSDLAIVAPMSLRMRRSSFITDYVANQQLEDNELLEGISKYFDHK